MKYIHIILKLRIVPLIICLLVMVLGFFNENQAYERKIDTIPFHKTNLPNNHSDEIDVFIFLKFSEDVNNGRILLTYKIASLTKKHLNRCVNLHILAITVNSYSGRQSVTKNIDPNYDSCKTQSVDSVVWGEHPGYHISQEQSDFIQLDSLYFYEFPYDSSTLQIFAFPHSYTVTNSYEIIDSNVPTIDWTSDFIHRNTFEYRNPNSLSIQAHRPNSYKYLIIILTIISVITISLLIFISDFSIFYQSLIAIFFGIWASRQAMIPTYINVPVLLDKVFLYIYVYLTIVTPYAIFINHINKKYKTFKDNELFLVQLIIKNHIKTDT